MKVFLLKQVQYKALKGSNANKSDEIHFFFNLVLRNLYNG